MADIYDSLIQHSTAIKTILEVKEEPNEEHFFEMTEEMVAIAKSQGVNESEPMYIWIPNQVKVQNQEVMVFTKSEMDELLKGKEIIDNICSIAEGHHETFKEKLMVMKEVLPENF